MKRAKGVTLREIADLTGWQAHTIRGFIGILGSKGGITAQPTNIAAGECVYKISK